MKAQTVDIKESAGRILCCTIFRPSGRKLLGKGHVLNEEDVRLLETEGLGQVWVTELEDGEVGEDEAVSNAAQEMGCGCLEIRLAAGGRANLFATEDCCVLVDDDLLKQINCISSVVIATVPNFTFARSGQRIATVKSTPFAVSQAQLEAVINIVKDRGPILQARAIRNPTVGVCTPIQYTETGRASCLKIFSASVWSVTPRHPVSFCPVPKRKTPRRAICNICCGPSLRWSWWVRLRRPPVRKMSSAAR